MNAFLKSAAPYAVKGAEIVGTAVLAALAFNATSEFWKKVQSARTAKKLAAEIAASASNEPTKH